MRKIKLLIFLGSCLILSSFNLKSPFQSYQLEVDYSLTLEQMIAAGNYSWCHNEIKNDNFPFPSEKQGKRESIKVDLYVPAQVMSSKEIILAMEKIGGRPATLFELLAFGSAYPNKQHRFSIVALGSVVESLKFFPSVPFLSSGESWRGVNLVVATDTFPANFRFLMVLN